MTPQPRTFLQDILHEAIAVAKPERSVPRHLPSRGAGRTVVIGAGKASAAMAKVVETVWAGPLSGLVITRYGHGVPTDRIRIAEAAHPVPDEVGAMAAREIIEMVSDLGPEDQVIALISGGGSALTALPPAGVSLGDLQALTDALLRSGASIQDMNCVRKHLSGFNGGRLARAVAPARLHTLIISDVVGDDLSAIASGPTVPDPTTLEDARHLLRSRGITPPPSIAAALSDPANESLKAGDAAFERTETRLIATAMASLDRMAVLATRAGITPLVLGDFIEGEAREVAKAHAGIARSIARHGKPIAPPALILSGGETSVTVRHRGRGGRNTEFLLALAGALDGAPEIYAAAVDSDGIDGSEENAGALIGPDFPDRCAERGLDWRAALDANDAYTLFERLEDLIVTGPTQTNVNDLRAILVLPAG